MSSLRILFGSIASISHFSTRRIHRRLLCRSAGHVTGSKLMQEVLLYHNPNSLIGFSSLAGSILVQAKDTGKLSLELENAIDEHRFDDLWKVFQQYMQMHGFPRGSIMNKLLWTFAETLDVHHLEKSHGVVVSILEDGKQNLLEKETLMYLSFSLAKCGLPVAASIVLRKLIDMGQFPHVSTWSATVAHMAQTANGAFLAADLVLEIGYLFQDGRVDPRKKENQPLVDMKPTAKSFSIVLTACILFRITRKAEQLLDMMPRIKIKTDTTLFISMALIYEKNGCIQELKKLRRFINEAYDLTESQFIQFYNCLLSCYLNFGDLNNASEMVLEMLRKAKKAQNSAAATSFVLAAAGHAHGSPEGNILDSGGSGFNGTMPFHLSYEDYCKDRNFRKLNAQVDELLNAASSKLRMQVELLTIERGILLPTDKMFVKLVKAFLEAGKMKELAEFLMNVEREDSSFLSHEDSSIVVHVINSCISLGWLSRAHDLLDEMRLAGVRMPSSVYALLIKAYGKKNQTSETEVLLRDARKAGVQLDSSCYDALIESRVLRDDNHGALDLFKEMRERKVPRSWSKEFEMLVKGCEEGGDAGLMTKLLHEVKDGDRTETGVHEWNNVIRFFCKKRLMVDAEKAMKKMRNLGYGPNAQTFHSLVMAYAAIGGKYTEVGELWGEMMSIASTSVMKFDQELLDSLLYVFVRGGFFVRANEVVKMIEKGKMFIDKYKYRALFLKYHRTMYKGKASKFQTEAKARKREAALSFKKWVGLS